MVGPWDIDGLLERLRLAGTDEGAGAAASSSTGGSSSVGGAKNGISGSSGAGSGRSITTREVAGSAGGYLIEVVEVKNTCPFGHSRR